MSEYAVVMMIPAYRTSRWRPWRWTEPREEVLGRYEDLDIALESAIINSMFRNAQVRIRKDGRLLVSEEVASERAQ